MEVGIIGYVGHYARYMIMAILYIDDFAYSLLFAEVFVGKGTRQYYRILVRQHLRRIALFQRERENIEERGIGIYSQWIYLLFVRISQDQTVFRGYPCEALYLGVPFCEIRRRGNAEMRTFSADTQQKDTISFLVEIIYRKFLFHIQSQHDNEHQRY